MAFVRISTRPSFLLVTFLTAILVAKTQAQQSRLGTVEFPTSGSTAAQVHFLRGVAALHSFWYPVALEEFRTATKIDPDFMLGYWGEAMAHNHPLWGDPQETEAARKVIEKINLTSELTPRERAYLQAVKILYGEGDKLARDKAYAAAMENIYQDHPNDLEVASFYALALLGTVHPNDPTALRTRMRAAAIALEIYRKGPNHPGAAHYILHAFDDPEHAILALPAARRYAEIAPAAPHALHMPSHIFLQLGMWPEAVASNEASWAASDQWVQCHDLPISQRDYHSLHWLLYAYLQQGRYSKAEELLTLMRESITEFPEEDMRNRVYGTFTQASMTAAYLAETQQWDAAAQILGTAHSIVSQENTGVGANPYQVFAILAQTPAIFARGLAAAMSGSPEAQKSMTELKAIREQLAGKDVPFGVRMDTVLEIQALEIAAAASAATGKFDEAIATMKNATALEEAMPPPAGPPPLIKPSHELFGELLLRANLPKEAEKQFATSLFRHPDRARSLLGVARAVAQQRNRDAAASAYTKFLQQWQQAEAQAPVLREAQEYMKRANAE